MEANATNTPEGVQSSHVRLTGEELHAMATHVHAAFKDDHQAILDRILTIEDSLKDDHQAILNRIVAIEDSLNAHMKPVLVRPIFAARRFNASTTASIISL